MSGIAGYADFGQKYTFTARPRALRLRYKANVGNITSLGLKQGELTTDDVDPASIYVCITDWTARHSYIRASASRSIRSTPSIP